MSEIKEKNLEENYIINKWKLFELCTDQICTELSSAEANLETEENPILKISLFYDKYDLITDDSFVQFGIRGNRRSFLYKKNYKGFCAFIGLIRSIGVKMKNTADSSI